MSHHPLRVDSPPTAVALGVRQGSDTVHHYLQTTQNAHVEYGRVMRTWRELGQNP